MASDNTSARDTQTAQNLDPVRLFVKAEENLTGFRQNLVQQAWEAAVRASESATPSDLDALIRLHAGICAIDFVLAHKPSVYREAAPI